MTCTKQFRHLARHRVRLFVVTEAVTALTNNRVETTLGEYWGIVKSTAGRRVAVHDKQEEVVDVEVIIRYNEQLISSANSSANFDSAGLDWDGNTGNMDGLTGTGKRIYIDCNGRILTVLTMLRMHDLDGRTEGKNYMKLLCKEGIDVN